MAKIIQYQPKAEPVFVPPPSYDWYFVSAQNRQPARARSREAEGLVYVGDFATVNQSKGIAWNYDAAQPRLHNFPARRLEAAGLIPAAGVYRSITGVTRDRAGAPLGNCSVLVFRVSDNVCERTITSAANGSFVASVDTGGFYYLVAFDAGTLAGATDNNLTGS